MCDIDISNIPNRKPLYWKWIWSISNNVTLAINKSSMTKTEISFSSIYFFFLIFDDFTNDAIACAHLIEKKNVFVIKMFIYNVQY